MNREDFIQHYVLARAAVLSCIIDINGILNDANLAYKESLAHTNFVGTAEEIYADKCGAWEKMATQVLGNRLFTKTITRL